MGNQRTILTLLVGILCFTVVCIPRISTVYGSTEVAGIIGSDTTWTKANSPYSLTGNMLVNNGATLIVEAGVTVNLNDYYIMVNGTLFAEGKDTETILFNNGEITFTQYSEGWNEQSSSGCIINNGNINQTVISTSNAMKIDSSIINGEVSVTSSIISNSIVTGNISSNISTISNNIITGEIRSLMSTISNNSIKGDLILGSVSLGAFTTAEESSTVFGNIVEGMIFSGSPKGMPEIFDNTVNGGGIVCTGYGSIHNNYVSDCDVGIGLYSTRVFGGYLACYATVENNIIVDNDRGIRIELSSLDGLGTQTPTVQYNMIANNSIGISLYESNYNTTPTIRYNNIENNFNYNFYLIASNNPDVSYNWWGTANESAINQSIYDFKYDFNLGTVNFIPFLTEQNVGIPEFPSWTILPLFLIATLSAIVLKKKLTSKN